LEYAYTFHSLYTSPKGVVVNLSTFMGSVKELTLPHDGDTGLFVCIVKSCVKKIVPEKEENCKETALPKKVTKLGVGVEGGFASKDEKFDMACSYSTVAMTCTDGSCAVTAEVPYNEDIKSSLPTPNTVLHLACSSILLTKIVLISTQDNSKMLHSIYSTCSKK